MKSKKQDEKKNNYKKDSLLTQNYIYLSTSLVPLQY